MPSPGGEARDDGGLAASRPMRRGKKKEQTQDVFKEFARGEDSAGGIEVEINGQVFKRFDPARFWNSDRDIKRWHHEMHDNRRNAGLEFQFCERSNPNYAYERLELAAQHGPLVRSRSFALPEPHEVPNYPGELKDLQEKLRPKEPPKPKKPKKPVVDLGFVRNGGGGEGASNGLFGGNPNASGQASSGITSGVAAVGIAVQAVAAANAQAQAQESREPPAASGPASDDDVLPRPFSGGQRPSSGMRRNASAPVVLPDVAAARADSPDSIGAATAQPRKAQDIGSWGSAPPTLSRPLSQGALRRLPPPQVEIRTMALLLFRNSDKMHHGDVCFIRRWPCPSMRDFLDACGKSCPPFVGPVAALYTTDLRRITSMDEICNGSTYLLQGREAFNPPPLFFEHVQEGLAGLRQLDRVKHTRAVEQDQQAAHMSSMSSISPESSFAHCAYGGRARGRNKWRAHPELETLMSWSGQPGPVHHHDFRSWAPVLHEKETRTKRVAQRMKVAEELAAREAQEMRERPTPSKLALQQAEKIAEGSPGGDAEPAEVGSPSGSSEAGGDELPTSAAKRMEARKTAEGRRLSVQLEQYQQRTTDNAHLQGVLPDAEHVLERLRGGEEGFSDSEMDRILATFTRFRTASEPEVHKDDLCRILKHLGYSQIDEDKVKELADEVTEYAALETMDFVLFVERFAAFERGLFRATFDKFNFKGTGVLDEDELRQCLIALGFTPLRKMIKEAMQMVDIDGSGSLDFEELVLLLAVYRHSEGFTREEIDGLTQVFNALAEQGEGADKSNVLVIPANKLAGALTRFFGPSSAEVCRTMQQELVRYERQRRRSEDKDKDDQELAKTITLELSELLLWARRVRDKEIDMHKQAFNKFDQDKSGLIDLQELQEVLKHRGYSLTPESVTEFVEEARSRGECNRDDNQLDFDEFVHLMEIFHDNDGFSKAEIEQFQQDFDRFDADADGDMDVVELRDLLHYLGHRVGMDDVHRLASSIDFDDNGTLDFREFIRFCRMHREEELEQLQHVFDAYQDEGRLPARVITAAVKAVNGEQEENADSEDEEEDEKKQKTTGMDDVDPARGLDFRQFAELVDAKRKERVKESRKRQGFSSDEIYNFKRMFDKADVRRNGLLDTAEVTQFIAALGFHIRTAKDQAEVVEMLRHAEAGAKGTEVDPTSQIGEIDFWVIVQLLRTLHNRGHKQGMARVQEAADACDFSVREVEDFRSIFLAWFEEDEALPQELEHVRELRRSQATNDGPLQDEEEQKELTKASLRRMMRTKGVNMDTTQRKLHDDKVDELTSDGMVDMAAFLYLMRWVLDTNFGGMAQDQVAA